MSTTNTISPLRQRMIEDMAARDMAARKFKLLRREKRNKLPPCNSSPVEAQEMPSQRSPHGWSASQGTEARREPWVMGLLGGAGCRSMRHSEAEL
jgi:hypothetical protein